MYKEEKEVASITHDRRNRRIQIVYNDNVSEVSAKALGERVSKLIREATNEA